MTFNSQADARVLEQSELRLRVIADTLPAYIAYVDDQMRYLMVNRMYEEQFGRSSGELLGHSVAEVLGDSYEGVRGYLERALGGVPQHFETRVHTVDGYRYLRVSQTPDIDKSGHVRGVIVHGFDITPRRRMEDELRASEERLKLALAAANGVGTWDWDIATDRVYADEAFARLYRVEADPVGREVYRGDAPGDSPEDALRDALPPGLRVLEGRPLADYSRNIHPDDQEQVAQAIREAIRTGDEYASEYRLVQADGSVRWVAARGRCTHTPDGTPLRFPGVSIDITDRKQSEDALRQAEKLAAVGRLASSIAHEINNPLESVVNLLYLIEHTTVGDHDAVRAYAQLAQEELARVSQIATQTLRFFKQSTHPTMIDIGEVLQSVLSLYRGRLGNSGIKVKWSVRAPEASEGETRAVVAMCREGELRQVLNNLVGNAVDAMRSGGQLLVRAREGTDPRSGRNGIRITIADTGHGMDRSTRGRIFDAFFTTKGIRGTGLGLWVSLDLVRKQQGSLRVRSSVAARHRGTVFVLFLPHLSSC